MMDHSLMLSGEQLFQLKCQYQEEMKRRRNNRQFNTDNDSTKREEIPFGGEMRKIVQEIEMKLKERFQILGTKRCNLARNMGEVEWCPQSRSSKVINGQKRPFWMGSKINNQLMYSPEETVFLMETERILVKYQKAQMSLQAAYKLILADNRLTKSYQIYSYLSRLGYKLTSTPRDDQTLSVKSTDTILKPSRDQLVQRINQLKSTSLPANCDNLRLVTMPLRREMFLNGTGFDKPATWSEYNRLLVSRDSPSVVFDEEATVLELNQEIISTENIFDRLPNASLVDPSNNLRPLIDQTKASKLNKLHQIMAEFGPRERNLHKSLPLSKFQSSISYRVYSATEKSFEPSRPDHHVVICTASHPPMVHELMDIKEKCGQSMPIYAVMAHSDFNFNTLDPFDIWDEPPTFWDPNLRSVNY